MTSERRAPVVHRRVADAISAATTPAPMPRTMDSGPCAIDQAGLPELRTARLMHSVYPVIAIASSKLAAATTVAGMAACGKQSLQVLLVSRLHQPTTQDAQRSDSILKKHHTMFVVALCVMWYVRRKGLPNRTLMLSGSGAGPIASLEQPRATLLNSLVAICLDSSVHALA